MRSLPIDEEYITLSFVKNIPYLTQRMISITQKYGRINGKRFMMRISVDDIYQLSFHIMDNDRKITSGNVTNM